MPQPVIANGGPGTYGAPGVTAAGRFGAAPADMLFSLRNNGWSDQQIRDVYGPEDPMVRIMQLENRWNQTAPGANGYRYQFPQRSAAPGTTQPVRQQTTPAQSAQSAQSTQPVQRRTRTLAQSASPTLLPDTSMPRIGQPAQSPQPDKPIVTTQAAPKPRQMPWRDVAVAHGGLDPLGLLNTDYSQELFGRNWRDLGSDFVDYVREAVPRYASSLYDIMRRAYYGYF